MKRVLPATAMLFVALCGFSQQYYESNALGMPLREIKSFRIDEFPYVLTVQNDGDSRKRTLFRDSDEVKRWELTYGDGALLTEVVYESGIISEQRSYRDGKIGNEVFYTDGQESERRTYIYENNELQYVISVGPDGEELYRDVYERDASGRLRRIHREGGADDPVSAFTYADGRLVQEWHGKSGEGVLFRYHDGNDLAEETWDGLKVLLAEEVREYEDTKKVVSTDNTLGLATTRYYDEEGNITLERTLSEDDLIEHVRYSYDGKKLLGKTRITRNAKEDWSYEYDQDGTVSRETLYRNSWIVKVVVHTGPETYYEDIYREGKPELRVFYRDGKKVDEKRLVGEQ